MEKKKSRLSLPGTSVLQSRSLEGGTLPPLQPAGVLGPNSGKPCTSVLLAAYDLGCANWSVKAAKLKVELPTNIKSIYELI